MGWISISTLNTVHCPNGCNALEYIGPSGYSIALVLQCAPPLCSVGFQCRAIDWGNHCSNASIVQLCHQMSILPTVERKHDEPLNTGSVASTINIIGFHCFVECLNQYSQSFWMEEIKVSKHFKCFPWRKSIKIIMKGGTTLKSLLNRSKAAKVLEIEGKTCICQTD